MSDLTNPSPAEKIHYLNGKADALDQVRELVEELRQPLQAEPPLGGGDAAEQYAALRRRIELQDQIILGLVGRLPLMLNEVSAEFEAIKAQVAPGQSFKRH